MAERIVHSFEAGRRGKPDELESGIANLIAAHFLERNPQARFDIRVAGRYDAEAGRPTLFISGEVSQSVLALPRLKQDLVHLISTYYYSSTSFKDAPDTDLAITFAFKPQTDTLATNQHAGDSGHCIAVAYANTPFLLPWERFVAVGIRDFLDNIYHRRQSGFLTTTLSLGLRADGKVEVSAQYHGARFDSLESITLAVQHEPVVDGQFEAFRSELISRIHYYLSELSQHHRASLGRPAVIINGLGPFVKGGWQVDEGSREAKPQRDGFGSYGCCEDSFSGEDPSKPSATGTLLARYIAVQVVAHRLADFARVGLKYTIGQPEVGLNITTGDTGKIPQEQIEAWVRQNISLGISDAITLFDLRNPERFRSFVAASDYFQSGGFPWNKKGSYTAPTLPLVDGRRL